ncbi:MAG: hypothetical protein A2Y10_12915 [Planctomycetes bacterium GWF2_41_51]|nr:MAG: hypothetical protein A2Y10_12915 [Planctomycetes bacterium GWF2_41_51]HBG28226.1 hypothetical protein [Phycisphaerales bacterium]
MNKLIPIILFVIITINGRAQSIYDDAIAYWQFEESSGQTISDSSGNGNNLFMGTSNLSDNLDALWLAIGFARSSSVECFYLTGLGGSSGFVSSGGDNDNLNIIATEPYTISVWVKCTNSSQGINYLLSKSESSGNYRGWMVSVRSESTDAPGLIEFLLRSFNAAGGRLWVRSQEKLSDLADLNSWIHITITYNGSMSADGVEMYVNGNSVLTKAVKDELSPGNITNCTRPFNICGRNNTVLSGAYIDETAMWNRVLSASEIRQCVNETNPIAASPTCGETIVYELSESTDKIEISLKKAPSSNVSVTITGNPLFDFGSGEGNNHNIIFTHSMISQIVTVKAVNNSTIENGQIYYATLSTSSSDPTFDNVNIQPLEIKYIDDDMVGAMVQHSSPIVTVYEQGQISDSYTIVLTGQPVDNVTVRPLYDSNEIVISPQSYVFTASDCHTPKTFTITAIDNQIGKETPIYLIPIDHLFTSNDTAFNNLTIDILQISKYDNDCSPSGVFLSGDINKDCKIDFADFALITQDWLKYTLPDVPACTVCD